jgi:hypothetical protein
MCCKPGFQAFLLEDQQDLQRGGCHNLKRKTGSTEDANEFICCIYISKSLSCGPTGASGQHIAERRVKTELLHF